MQKNRSGRKKYFADMHILLIEKLKEYTKEKAAVAFTGELKSRLLLGGICELSEERKKRILAVTACSTLRSKLEVERAKKEAGISGVDHYMFRLDELKNGNIRSNQPDRCYQCRRYLFKNIRELCGFMKAGRILCGAGAEDWENPEIRSVLTEFHIAAPFAELGLSKSDIAGLAAEMGISPHPVYPDPCFTTRFPTQTIMTEEKLKKVEQGEDFLRSMGFWDIRLQVNQNDVQIVAGEKEIPALMLHRQEIVDYFKILGYETITLNLEAYSDREDYRDLTSFHSAL